MEHSVNFAELFEGKTGVTLGGLRSSLETDFKNISTQVELQVLGLIGKYLTGPWMKKFYTDANSQISHTDGIIQVKNVIQEIHKFKQDPEKILNCRKDFFGSEVQMDNTLHQLQQIPVSPLFSTMMSSCLESITSVLDRQYCRYFGLDINERLREETASTRSHNINSEEMMGMFSEAQRRAPNATLDFLSCRMRSCKNRTVDYLDSLETEKREIVVKKAIQLGRMQREGKRKTQCEIRKELIRRQLVKEQSRDDRLRKKMEKYLKENGLEALRKEYPNLDYASYDTAEDILQGRLTGKAICHIWLSEAGGNLVPYNGLVRKLYANKTYKISYWTEEETVDDSEDWKVSMYELVLDLLQQTLVV